MSIASALREAAELTFEGKCLDDGQAQEPLYDHDEAEVLVERYLRADIAAMMSHPTLEEQAMFFLMLAALTEAGDSF